MNTSESSMDDGAKFQMKKRIGLWGAVALTTGCIVGTGIFVSPIGVLRTVHGSVGLSMLVWIGCGVIAMMSSLCYCELGTTFGASGGDYNNFKLAFGPLVAFWLVFLTTVWHAGNAATLQIFARYLLAPLFGEGCNPPESVIKLVALVTMCLILYLNHRSITSSVRVEIFFTSAKFLAMSVIAVVGMIHLAKGRSAGVNNFRHAFDGEQLSRLTFSDIARAFHVGIFPFSGWTVLNNVTEEIANMKKNMPRAAMLSLGLVTIIYLFVNVGYFSVLTVPEMLASKAVGVDFAHQVLGPMAWIIPISVCISTAGTQNATYLSRSRVPFVAARAGFLPKILSTIHITYLSPSVSLLAMGLAICPFILMGDFDTLMEAFGFIAFIWLCLSSVSVLVLRWKMPHLQRPYKVPLPIPVFVSIFSAYCALAPLIDNPSFVYFYAIGFFIIATVIYYAFMVKKVKVPGEVAFYRFLQKALMVAETDWDGFEFEG